MQLVIIQAFGETVKEIPETALGLVSPGLPDG
jgi:hypothetical protein